MADGEKQDIFVAFFAILLLETLQKSYDVNLLKSVKAFFEGIRDKSIKKDSSFRQAISDAVDSTIPATSAEMRRTILGAMTGIFRREEIMVQLDEPLVSQSGNVIKILRDDASRFVVFIQDVLLKIFQSDSRVSVDSVIPMIMYILLATLAPDDTPAHPLKQIDAIIRNANHTGAKDAKIRTLRNDFNTLSNTSFGKVVPMNIIQFVIDSVGSGQTNDREEKTLLLSNALRIASQS